MTQKDKELLLKDLCARLPYGVMVNAQYKDGEGWKIDDRKLLGLYTNGQVYLDCVYANIENIKPYLRPMSSMTEEEYQEYSSIWSNPNIRDVERRCINLLDWAYSHHFDMRNLIEKGLALEAPVGMYNIKKK